jgi:hypothetical protein
MDVKYYPLTEEWKKDFEIKRIKAKDFVENYTNKKLRSTLEDLPLIQTVIDAGVIKVNDVVKFQSLGVLFGDAIAESINADWCMIKDEYGEDPTLKIRGKQVNINALTIISKRIEENREIDLEYLFNELKEHIETHEYAED